MTESKFEAWRLSLDHTARFEAKTGEAALMAAHKACGAGTLAEFTAWLVELGARPFNTGKTWVLNVPGADVPRFKLNNTPTPATGSSY